jgi:hypothetical protein
MSAIVVVASTAASTITDAMTMTAAKPAALATTIEVVVVAIRRWLSRRRSVRLLGSTTSSQKSSLDGTLGLSISGSLLTEDELTGLYERGKLWKEQQ